MIEDVSRAVVSIGTDLQTHPGRLIEMRLAVMRIQSDRPFCL